MRRERTIDRRHENESIFDIDIPIFPYKTI